MKSSKSDLRLAKEGYEGRMIFLGQKVWEELRILARLAKGTAVEQQKLRVGRPTIEGQVPSQV
jgi:hypothetical protein